MSTVKTGSRIWVQLLLTVAAALLLVWTAVVIWQGYVSRASALKQAEDYSLSMHDAAMAGLTGMMVTGTVAQRGVFLDQLKQLGSVRDVRVLRGKGVSDTFGPGDAGDAKPDALEAQVLASGKAVLQVEASGNSEFLRAVRPALAQKDYLGKNCLMCHQVPEGTVLGVVSMKISLDHVNQDLAAQRVKSILAALFTSIPVLLLIYPFIRRVVTQPLESGVAAAREISSGNLTQDIAVTSRNEIGELQSALKEMTESLQRIVREVRVGTDSIFSASSDIASGNADLSSRTELQAANLERIADSMRELTETVSRNAGHAQHANQLTRSASDVAVAGGQVVAQVVDTMESINTSSRRIVDIISVIDGIAFQTNILALNAAVEAARAGEQGRGFAVVAGEVRSLAQRSASAAQEIKTLIGDSVHRVEAGSALVHQAGGTMKEIVDSIHRVSEIMGQIASASTEQTDGIGRVNGAISEMNNMTQQNAAMVEQAAAAAASLQEQASRLEDMVGVFKLNDVPPQLGRGTPALAAPAATRRAPALPHRR